MLTPIQMQQWFKKQDRSVTFLSADSSNMVQEQKKTTSI